MPHKLDSLLRPRSIAVVGASRRDGVVGNMILKNLLRGEYPGNLYAVNPGYNEVEGLACFPSLSELPEAVEHVIFAVNDERIENALDSAIAHGIKAGTIFSSLILANDTSPLLKERIYKKAKEANLLLCGANGMGYYNFTESIWACGFDTRCHRKQGNVTLISQSGAGMSGILDVDERLDFNFAVSTGQELMVSAEDYLDYALDQKETRVIGFFMETSRSPDKLIAAFEKANERKIPIVVIKVGRTALASKLAVSHSGAMAGADNVYNAIFDRYGVQRVEDMEELATTLIMFAQPHSVGPGGFVSLHDSGGERQLIIDLADKADVTLADLSAQTIRKLEGLLDPGLPAVNPLDAWSVGGPDYDKTMAECFASLLCDPGAALGAVVHDRAPFGHIYPEYIGYLRSAHKASGKPVFLVSNRQGTGEDPMVLESTREGFPVLDGVSAFLSGVKCLMAYRDFLERPQMILPTLSNDTISSWRTRFREGQTITENVASSFLAACGLPMNKSVLIETEAELVNSIAEVSYPLALKTANPEIKHKTEQKGVILDIQNEKELLEVYSDMSSRLGGKVLLSPMIDSPGIEMILGIASDEQFGPMIVMGFGGVYTEVLEDIVILFPPFDAQYAFHNLRCLRMRKILDEVRGKPAWDLSAYCEAAAILSVVALMFKDEIIELDINPVKVMEHGCLGLDALVVTTIKETTRLAELRMESKNSYA
ncbi:MAG: acyl-CoA synthetase (NDP forming) [Gammaproteobacteria bacterium]|jgi:acyl-CoA synthetase (NDP forming)